MAKILIVEDDKDLAEGIRKWLTAELHNAEISATGADALDRVLEGNYDIIILDIGLPDIDGTEICRRYRAEGGRSPIIMLTGKSDINDKVNGLDCGADDYVTKPFNAKELTARIRAILRRPEAVKSDLIKCGNVELDVTTHSVYKDGKKLTMFPVDYSLLEFLMRHPNEIFNSDALLAKVWSTDKAFTENAVRSSVRRLRRLLDGNDSADESNSIIETVSKVGYRLQRR
jgi:DNA-binding response OmpR family regulator